MSTCVHIRQLMDHLLFGGVRVLCWRRRKRSSKKRRRGTGPVPLGLPHCLLTSQIRSDTGRGGTKNKNPINKSEG